MTKRFAAAFLIIFAFIQIPLSLQILLALLSLGFLYGYARDGAEFFQTM